MPGAAREVWLQIPLTHLAHGPSAHLRVLPKRDLLVRLGEVLAVGPGRAKGDIPCHWASTWSHPQSWAPGPESGTGPRELGPGSWALGAGPWELGWKLAFLPLPYCVDYACSSHPRTSSLVQA